MKKIIEITELTYTRRKPEEQYGYAELTAVANVKEGESHLIAAEQLKQSVEKVLGLRETVNFEDVEEVTEDGNLKMKDGTIKKTEEIKIAHKEEVKEEPAVKEEVKEKKKPMTKQRKKAATLKEKQEKKEEPQGPKPTIKYDRAEQTHRDDMASVLNQNVPGWKTKEDGPKKAKALSESLVGEFIYDDEGNILKSFVELVIKGMK